MALRWVSRICAALASVHLVGCAYSSIVFAPEEPEQKSVPAAGHDEPNQPAIEVVFPDEPVLRVVAGDVSCTGTLIYENQVLTAHHCVSARDELGRVLSRDVSPEEVTVELGGDYLPWGEVGVRAGFNRLLWERDGFGPAAIQMVREHPVAGVGTGEAR